MTTPRQPVRLGIFGGTFDPIHLGHLRSAEEIRDRFGLAQVLFVPAARPPHKDPSHLVEPIHRLRMTELATADNDTFAVSSVEMDVPSPSYSIDTLGKLQNERGPLAELYFIIGADAFLEIHTWKDVEGLFQATHFVVTSRPGSPVRDLVHILEKTVTARWPALTFTVGFDERTGVETLQAAPSEKFIYLTPIVHLDISATDIR
ncbi:MAG: nicotinate-nucleotide adenylyltransferase, partial [Nitrospinota bacterium]